MTEERTVTEAICRNPDCTIAETGICLEGHEHYEAECPYYEARAGPDALEESSQPSDDVEIEETPGQMRGRRFWAGSELGVKDASVIMRARYTHLIGLVGPTGVGKTCFLNALYLKASSSDAPLNRYRFAGSSSLSGFEERARYARIWEEGRIPEKLSERTILREPRQPGFMHLRLAKAADPRVIYEILLTDLPGEWFETVIDDAASADRLMFLRRADGILFFVDAERLLDPSTRHQEVHRSQMLLGRLQETIGIEISLPFTVLIGKTDALERELVDDTSIPGVEDIRTEAQERGFRPSMMYMASFSRCPTLIPNGYGVEEALDAMLSLRNAIDTAEHLPPKSSDCDRSFVQFRGHAA